MRPNEWQRSRRRSSDQTITSKGHAYQEFFQQLIDQLRDTHQFTGARVGQPQSWYFFASGVSGISYGISFAQGGRVRAEIYIDRGEAHENKRMFDQLEGDKAAIEEQFGGRLDWERLDDRRASRIAIYRPGKIEVDAEELSVLQDWAIGQMLNFKSVFAQRIPSATSSGTGETTDERAPQLRPGSNR